MLYVNVNMLRRECNPPCYKGNDFFGFAEIYGVFLHSARDSAGQYFEVPGTTKRPFPENKARALPLSPCIFQALNDPVTTTRGRVVARGMQFSIKISNFRLRKKSAAVIIRLNGKIAAYAHKIRLSSCWLCRHFNSYAYFFRKRAFAHSPSGFPALKIPA